MAGKTYDEKWLIEEVRPYFPHAATRIFSTMDEVGISDTVEGYKESDEDTAMVLCMLPLDMLAHVICLTACTRTLSRASRACSSMRIGASMAAKKRGRDLGYDEFDPEKESESELSLKPGDRASLSGFVNRPEFNGQVGVIRKYDPYTDRFHVAIEGLGVKGLKGKNLTRRCSAIEKLHELHVDPATARLPSEIPCTGATALRILREEFAHFGLVLCQPERLVLPDEVDEQDEDTPGAAEYANLAALYCCVARQEEMDRGVDVTTQTLQRWIEGAWAEGFDAEGSQQFSGRLVGKVGEAGYIGAAEVLIALWHKRLKAYQIDFYAGTGPNIFDVVKTLYRNWAEDFDGAGWVSWVRHPMFLQEEGHSMLVVGRDRDGYQ